MNILNCIQFSFEILCLLMKEWNAIPIYLHGRWPVQKVLPTVSPALEDDAGEASQSGSAAPQLSRSHFSSAGTLLRGLPPLWKSCVGAAVQWVGLKMWKEHRRGKNWARRRRERSVGVSKLSSHKYLIFTWKVKRVITLALIYSTDVPTLWTQHRHRLFHRILSHFLLMLRPAASPSQPSSSFLMVSLRIWMKR